jgi:hypothetical protein
VNHELRYARFFKARPDEVFAAFTDPAGQDAFYREADLGWIVESQCDLRVGGVWTLAFGPSPSRLYRHRHDEHLRGAPRGFDRLERRVRPRQNDERRPW